MDIGSILNQAGGASAVARELGVDESTVESGVGALLPHVVRGVETQGLPGIPDPEAADAQVVDPAQGGGMIAGAGGLGGILGGLLGTGGSGDILGSLIGGGVGNEILSHIFGSKDTSREVATQASQQSGVDTSILKKLLPIVAGAVAMHYMTHRGQRGAAPAGGDILGGLMGR